MNGDNIWVPKMFSNANKDQHFLIKIDDCYICMPSIQNMEKNELFSEDEDGHIETFKSELVSKSYKII